jgi:DNA ligase-1
VLTRVPCPFAEFVDVCERIASTTGNGKKVDTLATHFLALSEANLQRSVNYLTGRPLPGRDERRSLQVGWALVRKALLQVSGLPEGRFRELSYTQNEPGKTAYLALQGCTHPRATSLLEIDRFCLNLKEARGPLAKVELLADRLRFLHPLEAKVLVQILMGDLRLGIGDSIVEEALAHAFRQPVEELRRAHMLLGDLGMAALFAKRNRLSEAELSYFTPVHCMLASAEESADGIWERLGLGGGRNRTFVPGSGQVWIEEKYDGIRAQLHRKGDRVELFSRDLNSLDASFPEVLESARDGMEHDVVLDGEIVAFADGQRLSFMDLQTRLGRTRMEGDLFRGQAAPVQFIVFDLLCVDGVSLLDEPLRVRRQVLETLALPRGFSCIERRLATGPREIEEAFRLARRNGNEGLMAKDPESFYHPGRRGKSWLKLKRALASLDVVVTKVEQGSGKRSHVLSDYTFAVRDEHSGELVTLGKAFTGLPDEELENLTEHFREHTLKEERRARIVQPNVVLEVVFDAIRPSRRHRSGLALRFPRIRAVRRDKTPGEIDTLQTAQQLAALQPSGA